MPVWLGATIGIAALLAAAKAHGRQVRLEREAAGYHSVEFGGTNPEFVERLWRRDRIRFWTFVPLAALLMGGAQLLARAPWSRVLLASLLWAPIAGFFFAGLWTYAARRGEGGPRWWIGAAALASASAIAALV